MALNGGIDTVSYLTIGLYSETYTSADAANIASLFVTLGLLEDAPAAAESSGWIGFIQWFYEFF